MRMTNLPFLPILFAVISYSQVVNAFKPIRDSPIGGEFYHYISENYTGDVYYNFTKLIQEEEQRLKPPRGPMNHFTTIGMPPLISGFGEIKSLIEEHGEKFVHVPLAAANDCFYNLFKSESGAQIWGEVQTHQGRRILRGFVPHFEGKSKQRVCLLTGEGNTWHFDDGKVSDKVLNGGFLAVWDYDDDVMDFLANHPEVHDGEEGITLAKMVTKTEHRVVFAGLGCMDPDTRKTYFAFNFDCPNFGFLDRDTLHPILATIQLSAFAREIKTFSSEKEYYASLTDRAHNASLSSQFFGASDVFNEADDSGYAVIVGHVIQAEKKTNELTGKSFYWALVRTAGGMEIDVVIHESLPGRFGTKPPQVGGVLRVYAWLSGRLISVDP